MKSILTIASLVALGSLAVLSSNHNNVVNASPVTNLEKRQQKTIAERWCDAFADGCTLASREVCGGNNISHHVCDVSFINNACSQYTVSCTCTPTGGSEMSAAELALRRTFAATNGACSSLPAGPVSTSPTPSSSSSAVAVPTSPSSSASPPASTSAPTSVATSPSGKNGAFKSRMSLSAVAFTATISLGLFCM
ncbi:hypothetical protein BC939DRAFT_476307 [Gamsiella multidivaricata]|uniref:uncharacterized protein n=1 Tax=Gamsiella multidivaricata TaxID=101098 RepID=UPI002220385E|nr:uncharacterized protein BC939DRAFT_476307 [Gamsiella multidivaricata]KAI7825382.1 hypothetical protein BC939DRAFT_476307 [Gamsiella multidivaricata]